MNKTTALFIFGWFALWLTEVMFVKVAAEEPIPIWQFGGQTLLITLFLYVLLT